MNKVNLKNLRKLLPYFEECKIPLYLWGRPSSGKTSMIKQFAQEKAKKLNLEYSEDQYGPEYFTCKIITMSQYDAPDLRGMPQLVKVDSDTMVTRFLATEELPRNGQGIIFFDELNLADESIRAAIYSYILEGRISNLPKINTFWRVAASNSESDFCSVNSTPLALLSRFCHLEVEPQLNEIVEYFLNLGLDSRIVGYLQNFPEDLFPAVWDERLLEAKANPFPRQWQNLGNLMMNFEEQNSKGKKKTYYETLVDLAAACVGPQIASKFVAFCKTTEKIDIKKIINEPKILASFKDSNDRVSLYHALISSLASLWYAKDKLLTPEKAVALIQQFIDLKAADFAVALSMLLLKKRSSELIKVPGFTKILNSISVYVDPEDSQVN